MLFHLPRTSVGFQFSTLLPLLKLKGIGWELNTSHQYVWEGSTREDEHFLFQYTVSGQGELHIKGTSYKLQAGDAFIIEIPSDHCYRLPAYSKEWEVLYLEFSKEALPFWRHLLTTVGPVISIPPDSSLAQLSWSIYELAVKNEIYDVYQCSNYAYQFIMLLMSHTYQNQKNKPLPSKIELCKQYIDLHYRECIGLKEIAEAAGLSKFHLTREFERRTGVSPIQYLTDVRIEKSTKLLADSTENLENIAKQVGFSCANYYGKVFKKRMGISPNEFRKNYNYYDVQRVLFES